MKKITFLVLSVALMVGVFASTNLLNQAVQAAVDYCNPVIVTNEDISRQVENTTPLRNWVLYNRAAGNGTFRAGPSAPPLGVGSLELVTPTSADKVTLFNYDHTGTQLDAIDKMGYSTYRISGSGQQVAAINLQVDIDGDGDRDTNLVFEPVYNTNQGLVESGKWQTWDAYNGGNATWWSSDPIPSAPNRDTFVSWNTIVAANPDAVILGGFGINQGSGNPALTTATDALYIGYGTEDCYTYNFEPYRVATTSEGCKNGGWKNLRREDGSSFTNQGDCVSYTRNGK